MHPDNDAEGPRRRKEDLLGNGTLTLLSRFSSVWGAAVLAAAIGIGTWLAPKAWDVAVEAKDQLNRIEKTLASVVQKNEEQDRTQARFERRFEIIEGRLYDNRRDPRRDVP